MDIAYDHIQEEAFSNKEGAPSDSKPQESNANLNDELQETFRAFSASPWGSRIGGLWDNVRKQGETYYEGARQEYAAVLRDSPFVRSASVSLRSENPFTASSLAAAYSWRGTK